jgi:hypothetical protein
MSDRRLEFNPAVARILLWTGPALVVALVFALIPLAHLIPPPSPALGRDEIAAFFAGHTMGIRIGCVLMMIFFSLFATWSAVVIGWIWRTERGFPVITIASVAIVGASTVFFTIAPLTWAVAAFRPGEFEAETVRTLNDWAWFGILFSWPPFAVFCALIALAVFTDRSPTPVFPRWVGYYNVWEALFLCPFLLIAFFKTGPFAWDGAIGFYLPTAGFCVWLLVMTGALFRSIKEVERCRAAEPRSGQLSPA